MFGRLGILHIKFPIISNKALCSRRNFIIFHQLLLDMHNNKFIRGAADKSLARPLPDVVGRNR